MGGESFVDRKSAFVVGAFPPGRPNAGVSGMAGTGGKRTGGFRKIEC